jgi:lipoprotein-anchoring transpeptidase ErfK/SrfK
MRIALGQIMTQTSERRCGPSQRVNAALVFVAALFMAPTALSTTASAQALGYASAQSDFPTGNTTLATRAPALTSEHDETGTALAGRLRRTVVSLETREAPGTVIIDTGSTALYYVLGQGRAIRYGVGVGREGFTWSGVQSISRKAEWPDWHPPAQMIARQPYLPRFMAGGPGNPLGARAMYLGSSEYRIHGTNDPSTIGKFVSSGCIRLTNEDVADLFSRVQIGTRVVVLGKNSPHPQARAIEPSRMEASTASTIRPVGPPARPAMATVYTGRQAMNLSSSLY